MFRTIKVRLYPNPEQLATIDRQLEGERFMYNQLVEFAHNHFRDTHESISMSLIYKQFKVVRDKFPIFKEILSVPLVAKRYDFNKAMARFFKEMKRGNSTPRFDMHGEPTGWLRCEPKFHTAWGPQSCRFPKQCMIRINGNRLTLSVRLTDMLYKCSRRDERFLNSSAARFQSVTVTRSASGQYFASIKIIDNSTKHFAHSEKSVGIDLGLIDAITATDGDETWKVPNPKFLNQVDRKIRKLQHIQARRTLHSGRREKIRKRVAREYERLQNRRRNFWQQQSTKLVRKYQTIGIEDLCQKTMLTTKRRRRSIHDVSWPEFRRILEYKCAWRGRNLIKVDQHFASTQLCSACGFQNKNLRCASIRSWTCPRCGAKHDRDANAATNILNESKRILVGLGSPEPIRTGTGQQQESGRNSGSGCPGGTVKQKEVRGRIASSEPSTSAVPPTGNPMSHTKKEGEVHIGVGYRGERAEVRDGRRRELFGAGVREP